ncbi:MAG: tetratricopeptide repeat protein [Streptomyces sp.]|uniref:tetratricopeptide repeat protein n=1 Tax=Streptomyces sp. TaxID=1931 RepID=UPI0025E48165|nr:tetratricopeptide repeat protein [Streptomyces sp.]MBW8800907.1 tetratricopeptide repeat protein [Streptomyces sp.]
MRPGMRWMLVVVLNVLAFATVFLLCYAVRVPLMPVSDDNRVAVGVAAATVAATVGGTWGAWWAPRAVVAPEPGAVRLELPHASVTVTAPAPAAEPSHVRVRMGDLPREPVGFQPRRELLAELTGVAEQHELTVVHAVTGARGVGKTQLAAAYARRRIEDGWPVVAWITAENSGQLASGLADLADQLGVRQSGDDTVRAAQAALAWIRRNPEHRCLLVLDNATDPDEVSRWLPTAGHAQVVVTATSRAFEYLAAARVDVTVFTEEEALAFLRERVGPADDGAAELAGELGRLPLALAQAAHVIRSRGTGYRPYLARLRGYPLDSVLERVPGERYPHRLAEAVLIALEQAQQTGPPAAVRTVLQILSVLSPAGVPRELLEGAAREAGVDDPTAVADALGTLFQASLATDTGTDAPSLHRLVQRVVRERAGAGLEPLVAAVARYLKDVLVPVDEAWERREFASQLVDQIDALWSVLRGVPVAWHPDLWTDLVLLRRWAAAGHLRHVGGTTRALGLAVRTRADCEAVLGEEAPALRHALELEGDLYSTARRSEQASVAYLRRLELAERLLAPDDPDLVQARQDLAGAYLDSGRYELAVPMFEELEREARRRHGPDHEETREALDGLANAYTTAGRRREAVGVVERLRADVLGSTRPSAAGRDSLPGLADAYQAVDEAEEGVAVQRRYVEECRLAYGAAARETLLARNRLARHCSDAELHTEAVAVAQEAVADAEAGFGPLAVETFLVRDTLAYCLQTAERDQEANDIFRRLVEDETTMHGAEHTRVLRARRQLVWSFDMSVRHREAYDENRTLVEDHERILGPEDPATLDVRHSHIALCIRHGRGEEAVERARELCRDNERLCGPRDPQTFQVRLALADALVAAARHSEAEELLRDTVRESEQALSPDHPKVFYARAQLADLLLTTGSLREATELWERTVAEYVRLYGEDHPHVVWARVRLAGALQQGEEYEAMLALHRRIVVDVDRRWGEDHPSALLARRRLAWACGRAGRYHEQLALAERSVADHDRHYGADSLLAVIVRRELARALLWAGHRRASRRLARQLHTRLRAEMGDEHPLTIAALEDVAGHLRAVQRRLKALRLRRRALSAWEARSGPWSWDTVHARCMYGFAYASAGLVWRNAAVQKRLFDDLTAHFGPEHETTLTYGDWWIHALRTTGRWRRARETARRRLAIYEGRYGPDHPWTLEARRVVAFNDRRTLRVRTSLAGYAALAEARARVQGADHPMAVQARSNVARATLWTLRPRRALELFGSVLTDLVGRYGPDSRQVGTYLRYYIPLCLFTGDLRRLRAALRVRRRARRS